MEDIEKLVKELLANESTEKVLFLVLYVNRNSIVCCVRHPNLETQVTLACTVYKNVFNFSDFLTFRARARLLFKLLEIHNIMLVVFDYKLMTILMDAVLGDKHNSIYGLYNLLNWYYKEPRHVHRRASPLFIDMLDILTETRGYTFDSSKRIHYTLDLVAILLNFNLSLHAKSDLNFVLDFEKISSRDFLNYARWSINLLLHCYSDYMSWIKIRILFSKFFNLELLKIAFLTRRNLAEQVILLDESNLKTRKQIQKDPDIAANYHLLYPYKHSYVRENIVKKEKNSLCIGNAPLQCGFGGLHSIHKAPSSYVADDEYLLIECDISSYYPTLIVQLLRAGIDCPLPNLLPTLEGFLNERLRLKNEGKQLEAGVYKIILNSIYGSTNYKASKIYAPIITYSVTINGQLLILEILESLLESIEDLLILWVNTDGFVLKLKRSQEAKLRESLANYRDKYGVDFGTYQELSSFYIKNVNSYIMVTNTNDVKIKGLSQVTEPLCFNKVLKAILSTRKEKSLSYTELCQQFVEVCDFKDFIYINKERYNNVIRYICSQKPRYFGGNIPIKSKNQISHNFTLCETNLSGHKMTEVCIDYYAGTLLKKLEEFDYNITNNSIERANEIWLKLERQQPTFPLFERGYQLAKQNIFIAAGKGMYIFKEHSVSEELSNEPLLHLNSTLANAYFQWVDAATLYVQDINLLILKIKDVNQLTKYKPDLTKVLKESWYISSAKESGLVCFFQIEESIGGSTSKHLPLVNFFKKLNAQSKAGCKLVNSFPVFGNTLPKKETEERYLDLKGEELKKFPTVSDALTLFSSKTEFVNTTGSDDVAEDHVAEDDVLEDDVLEDNGTPVPHLPQPITEDSGNSTELTYLADGGRVPAVSVPFDQKSKVEVSSMPNGNHSQQLDSKVLSLVEKLTNMDSKSLAMLERLANMDSKSLAILERLANMDSKSLAMLERLANMDSKSLAMCSIEPDSGDLRSEAEMYFKSTDFLSKHHKTLPKGKRAFRSERPCMNRPTPEDTIGLDKDSRQKMYKFYYAADSIIEQERGMTLERNLIVLFMLWVTQSSVTDLHKNWTLGDFITLLETPTKENFTIKKHQRQAVDDIKTICSNYLSKSKSSPLVATYRGQIQVGESISFTLLCAQLNKILKPLGMSTTSFRYSSMP